MGRYLCLEPVLPVAMRFHPSRSAVTSALASPINLPNFQTVFRQDRNKNGGGVCIFVSDQLSCSRRSDLESQDLELLWVEVFLQQSPRTQYPLLIGCCYRPPNSPMHFYEKLETTLDNVVTKNILLLGDFNAKHQEWCSRDVTTHHGNALRQDPP